MIKWRNDQEGSADRKFAANLVMIMLLRPLGLVLLVRELYSWRLCNIFRSCSLCRWTLLLLEGFSVWHELQRSLKCYSFIQHGTKVGCSIYNNRICTLELKYPSIRFYFAVGLYSENGWMTSKRGENIRYATRLWLVAYFFVLITAWRHLCVQYRSTDHGN